MTRADYLAIAARVPEGAQVLDVGCGDGSLLALLKESRGVDARGLELTGEGVGACLARGLPVIQGDADEDLEIFPDNRFDVAIMSKTIQEMRRPEHVLRELSRVAPDVIISFRNYGQWRRRLSLLVSGRMPAPRQGGWHDAEALHPSSAADMADLAESLGLELVAAAAVSGARVGAFRAGGLTRLNWAAEDVILHLRRGSTAHHSNVS